MNATNSSEPHAGPAEAGGGGAHCVFSSSAPQRSRGSFPAWFEACRARLLALATASLGLARRWSAALNRTLGPLRGEPEPRCGTITASLCRRRYLDLAAIQALADNDGARALEMIAAGDHPVDAIDVITPLFAALEYVMASRLRHRVVRALLKAGAPVDQTTIDGSTPLMLAAYRGDLRAAMELLERGADPLREKEVDGNVQTPISAALHANNHEIAELIREYIGESGARLHAAGDAPKTEL